MRCLCLNTRRAARSLTTLYEEYLRPSGLTSAQFGLLSLLALRPGLSQKEIAKSAHLDQTTLSRNLQLLINSKWIKRGRSASDARQSLYTITAAGLTLQQEALPQWKRAQEQMRKRLGDDWETAFALLQRISDATA